MSKLQILSDEPAGRKEADLLRFDRYLTAIEKTVLSRNEPDPFVVAIYGKWGSGKTSLLRMLAELLEEKNKEKYSYEIVEFSPWLYRTETSLLMPLLATLAKRRLAFEKLVSEIAKSGPGFIKMLAGMKIPGAAQGLPLLTFLTEIRQNKEHAKDLPQKIEEAIQEVTRGERIIVFLIDDLDRCHDPDQVIGLLEQLRHFFHLKRCLFFIGVDRDQLIQQIEKKYPGQGKEYLDKFVQLPLQLYPHVSRNLVDIIGHDKPELNRFLMRVSDVIGNNPRTLKRLWNQAVVGLKLLQHELSERVTGFSHEPSLELMMKWLLLRELLPETDPFLYLEVEEEHRRKGKQGPLSEDSWRKMGMKVTNDESSDPAELERHRRLALFLQNDLRHHQFKSIRVMRLYAMASGEDRGLSRIALEEAIFSGKKEFVFQDFTGSDLTEGQFAGAVFRNCDFTGADLTEANLEGASFEACILKGSRFDGACVERVNWCSCEGANELDTEPFLYEGILDQMVSCWEEKAGDGQSQPPEQLYKAYKTIIELHRKRKSWTEDIQNRLVEKGRRIRQKA